MYLSVAMTRGNTGRGSGRPNDRLDPDLWCHVCAVASDSESANLSLEICVSNRGRGMRFFMITFFSEEELREESKGHVQYLIRVFLL